MENGRKRTDERKKHSRVKIQSSYFTLFLLLRTTIYTISKIERSEEKCRLATGLGIEDTA